MSSINGLSSLQLCVTKKNLPVRESGEAKYAFPPGSFHPHTEPVRRGLHLVPPPALQLTRARRGRQRLSLWLSLPLAFVPRLRRSWPA